MSTNNKHNIMEGIITRIFYILLVVTLIPTEAGGESLYTADDDIVLLNTASFNRTILGASNAWLVEFYSSWCGHCIRYAPIYKQMATDVKAWRSIVALAAVDCAENVNTDICREYSISHYPTLVWLPAHAASSSSEVEIDHLETVEAGRHGIIDYLQKHFDTKTVTRSNVLLRRMLAPLTEIDDIWKHGTDATQYFVLIVEDRDSYVGREVILDLSAYHELAVRRMIDGKFNEPGLYVVKKSNDLPELEPLSVALNRKEYVSAAHELIRPLPNGGRQLTTAGLLSDKWLKLSTSPFPYDRTPQLHQQDLESGLHYSLRHEVALYSVIEGEQLAALTKYIKALAKFLPVRPVIRSFLESLHGWLVKQESLTGSIWLDEIEQLQTVSSYLPESLTWTGCRGSQVRFRGYPCSLWMTFHSLLVSAANQPDKSMTGREVLLAVRGYVKFFFGCRECVQNFMRGAVHIESRVHTDTDAVLFLWRSHNKANFHLHGDATEDPEHPKFQFPTDLQCPACHASSPNGSDVWVESEVVSFLGRVYSESSIVFDTENDRTERKRKTYTRPRGESENEKSFTAVLTAFMRHENWENATMALTKIDLSLCLAFYLVCTGFIGILYWRFCRRCRFRKFGKSSSSYSVA